MQKRFLGGFLAWKKEKLDKTYILKIKKNLIYVSKMGNAG